LEFYAIRYYISFIFIFTVSNSFIHWKIFSSSSFMTNSISGGGPVGFQATSEGSGEAPDGNNGPSKLKINNTPKMNINKG